MDILFLIIGLILGVIIGKLFFGKKEYTHLQKSLEQQNESLKQNLENKNITINELNQKIGSAESDIKNKNKDLEKQKEELENIQKKLTTEFENLANKILDQKSQKFSQYNKEQIENILKPLQENIGEFKQTVKENYDNENKDKASLKTQIQNLMDLNKQLSNDANNLTNALKGDSKIQGDWGETQLEMLLEKASLKKGINYRIQESIQTVEGKTQRPDFIIDLPDEKNLIIDAKVSLTAYERFCSSRDDMEKTNQLKNHINSIKNHIKELSKKEYENLHNINTPDYVLMFIPIEPALTLVLQNNTELFNEALNKNIILVSTSTLLATMRTVSFIWKQENQKQNVLKMAQECGKLYDKFEGFTNDLLRLGNQINQAKISYDGAMNKLSTGSGNLVKRVENIKKLGAKTSKSINEKLKTKALKNE